MIYEEGKEPEVTRISSQKVMESLANASVLTKTYDLFGTEEGDLALMGALVGEDLNCGVFFDDIAIA